MQAGAFQPQILFHLAIWLVETVVGCPLRAWRDRKRIGRALFCWPCAAFREGRRLVRAAEERRAALTRRLTRRSHGGNGGAREEGKKDKEKKEEKKKRSAVEAYRAKMEALEKAAAKPAPLPSPAHAAAAPTQGTLREQGQLEALKEAYKNEAATTSTQGAPPAERKPKPLRSKKSSSPPVGRAGRFRRPRPSHGSDDGEGRKLFQGGLLDKRRSVGGLSHRSGGVADLAEVGRLAPTLLPHLQPARR